MIRYLSWPWVAGLTGLLSLVQYGPLVARLGSAVAGDAGDPLLNTWILWWNTQAIPVTEAYWNAPSFAPAPRVFALSETLVGLTWLTTPLQWLGGSPLVAYNVMLILTPVLNGLSAYWLCLTITARPDAAVVGGLAFAFAPYHASQLSHLQMQAAFFMPAALASLHRYWNSGQPKWIAWFGAATVMNGLVCGYFLVYFSVLIALVIAWLAISRPDARKLTAAIAALIAAAVALSPILLTYRDVQLEWDLRRTMTEIEQFSADLTSFGLGSLRLALWPLSPSSASEEVAAYPGVAICVLLIAAMIVALRKRRAGLPAPPRWRTRLVQGLSALSLLVLIAGVAVASSGRPSYKVIGIAIDLALIAAVLSTHFTRLVSTGSPAGLYATGFIVSSLLALGPVARVFGHRFWYKPPFAWLMDLPGFSSTRVPARFSSIAIVCLAVLAAVAVTRIWQTMTRRSIWASAALAAAIVADGWIVVPVVSVPRPLPIAVNADLVVELPTQGYEQDIAAMYRGMTHQRPVVNGYSGWLPTHYVQLQADLRHDCMNSLEGLRGARSIDAVIWRADPHAAAADVALRSLWPGAGREETADVIVYRQPRAPATLDPAKTSCARF